MKKMVNVKMVNVKGKLQIKISKFKNPNLKSIKCITRQRTHQTGFRNFFLDCIHTKYSIGIKKSSSVMKKPINTELFE